MKYLVFHSSVAPFVQQAARAFYEVDCLERFLTTLRENPHSAWQQLACRVGDLAGWNISSRLARRAITEVPPDCVDSKPFGEILRLLIGSLDRGGRLTDLVWERVEPAFDRAVARTLHEGLVGVYGYEYCSLATFQRAAEMGRRVIYDMPAPEPRYVQKLLDKEIEEFPELRDAYHQHTSEREDQRIARRQAEYHAADVVIAASQFTRVSFENAGLPVDKVRVVPYGAPPPVQRELACRIMPSERLRLIWGGTFGIRKGAHLLLQAWKAGGLGRFADLHVCGSVTLPERLMRNVPEGIVLRGSLPREEWMGLCQNSDALIFPTLCDGFGMVVTEAWSQGLPVITTGRAGAADLLRPGENGLLIPAGHVESIQHIIEWARDHRVELHGMRESALNTAEQWQWKDYRHALRAAVGLEK